MKKRARIERRPAMTPAPTNSAGSPKAAADVPAASSRQPPAFGHDFSRIRVHADAPEAAPMILRDVDPDGEAGGKPDWRKKILSPPASKTPPPALMRSGGLIVATVYFDQNRFVMDGANSGAVEKLGEELRLISGPTLTVDGYASREGDAKYNQDLSEMRRQTVLALLGSGRLAGASVAGKAHGAAEPAAEEAGKGDELEGSRALNRRVTIVIAGAAPLAEPSTEGKPEDKTGGKPDLGVKKEPTKSVIETEPPPKGSMEDAIRHDIPKRPERSLGDDIRAGIDKAADALSDEFGIKSASRRKLVREAAQKLAETGAEKLFDQATESVLNGNQQQAVKAAVNRLLQTPKAP